MSGRRIAAVAALGLSTVAVAGCGGGSSSSETTSETTTTASTTTTTIASGATLAATVGPGFTIGLTGPDGKAVESLSAGTYTIEVDDQSNAHNFHLTGEGVDKATSVSAQGKETWKVTLVDGKYHYQCDPHASEMNGDFEVTG
jgi:plastocyanin